MFSEEQPFRKSKISKTLSQTIYKHLKEEIVSNRLEANQRVIEKDIARKFGVSTTPVREALLRLAAEGYLFIDSHRKTVVKAISYKELTDIIQVLAELDSIAIEYAVDFIKTEQLHKITMLTKQLEDAGREGDIEKFLDINTSIHQAIWDAIPNRILKTTIESVHGQLMRYTNTRFKAFRDSEILERSLEDHEKILEALADKDKRALRPLMKRNWTLLIDKRAFPSVEGERPLQGGDVHTMQKKGGGGK